MGIPVFQSIYAYKLFMFLAGVGNALEVYDTEAEKEMAVIGMSAGAAPIIFCWIVGTIVLWFLVWATRAKRN